MKIAIPCWNHHVSTVCDFSKCLLLVTVEAGSITTRTVVNFVEKTTIGKTVRLQQLGVQVLLCGAVSQSLERMIITSGIKVVPFLKGTVEDVLDAYLSSRLFDPRFALPGRVAGRRRRRARGIRKRGVRDSGIL